MNEPFAIASRVAALQGSRVLCAGDVMLDRFVYGDVTRISPEAPIPVCRVANEVSLLGGAGNVVRNLAALGARADAIFVTGDDAAGSEIAGLIGALDGVNASLLSEAGRTTTVKTRYVAAGQQLLRADHETEADIAPETAADIVRIAADAISDAGAVILSDYGKGVLTEDVTGRLISAARNASVPVIVDPQGSDYARYRGATLLTPNRRELSEASRMSVADEGEIVAAARHIIDSCGVDGVLVTRSAEGITLLSGDDVHHLAAEAREVFDVSGAGDTVAATMAASLAAGLSLPDAAGLANVAAGIVVGKTGTAVAFADDVVNALRARDLLSAERKAVSLAAALDHVADWRRRGETIGFTNGCFDLIHPGHVSLLEQACGACDRLVVGLNSDASAARLKGPGRPAQSEAARAAVLGALASVDLVVIFAEDTPMKIIESVRPDILVKGADYAVEEVVGGDFVQGYGGRVMLAELADGHSTTATIERLAK